MTTVSIKADTYRAEFALDLLPQLPSTKIRKLFRLLFSHAYENPEAIYTITDWLPRAVTDAKNSWGYAVAIGKENFIPVKKGSRKSYDVELRKRNRELMDTVKSAKSAYEALVKLQSIFTEIKNKEK